MTDLFYNAEASQYDSKPRELYEITCANKTYYLTSADQEYLVSGQIYTPDQIGRGDISIVDVGGKKTQVLKFTLRGNHDIVKRWHLRQSPPKSVVVKLRRYQAAAGVTELLWEGYVTTINSVDGVSTISCSSIIGEAFKRRLPTLSAGRQCPYALYEVGCTVSDSSSPLGVPLKQFATIISVTGRSVRLDLTSVSKAHPYRPSWLVYGKLLHMLTKEIATIAEQKDVTTDSNTETIIKLRTEIPGMKVGDLVTVWAGCDHYVNTCRGKFDNLLNFGGMPHLPKKNPHLPTGWGILEMIE